MQNGLGDSLGAGSNLVSCGSKKWVRFPCLVFADTMSNLHEGMDRE